MKNLLLFLLVVTSIISCGKQKAVKPEPARMIAALSPEEYIGQSRKPNRNVTLAANATIAASNAGSGVHLDITLPAPDGDCYRQVVRKVVLPDGSIWNSPEHPNNTEGWYIIPGVVGTMTSCDDPYLDHWRQTSFPVGSIITYQARGYFMPGYQVIWSNEATVTKT